MQIVVQPNTKSSLQFTVLYVGVLFALGDVIAQKLVEKQKKLDWGRTSRFGLIGFCFAVSAIIAVIN